MTIKRILHTVDDTREWCSYLYTLPFPVRVAALTGEEDRTKAQNRLIHEWFADVGNQTGESAKEVKLRAKLDIGCPILCRDDPEFSEFFDLGLKHLPYDKQRRSMKFVPVTSILTVRQMSEFMDQFEKEHRAQGLYLTIPEDRT